MSPYAEGHDEGLSRVSRMLMDFFIAGIFLTKIMCENQKQIKAGFISLKDGLQSFCEDIRLKKCLKINQWQNLCAAFKTHSGQGFDFKLLPEL